MNIRAKFYFYFAATILLSPVLIFFAVEYYRTGLPLHFFAAGLCIFGYLILYLFVRRDFLLPFKELQRWLDKHKSDHGIYLNEEKKTSMQPVAKAVNHLIKENQHLYDDMENILNKQIERLSKKSTSLETLYGISSKLNEVRSINELFTDFLHIFVNMTGACCGVARSVDGNFLYLAAAGGENAKNIQTQVALMDCACGKIIREKDTRVQFSVHTCERCVGVDAAKKAPVGTIFIPIQHGRKPLGIFSLFFDKEPSLAFDERILLETIADNVAASLDKAYLSEEARRMELSQERLLLSQEIHDSLAQTLYSLKLQTSALGDFIKDDKTRAKMNNLKLTLAQANDELRELMQNFRISLSPKGIKDSLHDLVEHFKQKEGIAVYLQVVGRVQIQPEVELQIIRITQEALTNVRKHAKARNVRILLLGAPTNQLLIEDDGVGFTKKNTDKNNENGGIGMNIMRERSMRIGAKLNVESEAGEGTRVILSFGKAYENLSD